MRSALFCCKENSKIEHILAQASGIYPYLLRGRVVRRKTARCVICF